MNTDLKQGQGGQPDKQQCNPAGPVGRSGTGGPRVAGRVKQHFAFDPDGTPPLRAASQQVDVPAIGPQLKHLVVRGIAGGHGPDDMRPTHLPLREAAFETVQQTDLLSVGPTSDYHSEYQDTHRQSRAGGRQRLYGP